MQLFIHEKNMWTLFEFFFSLQLAFKLFLINYVSTNITGLHWLQVARGIKKKGL